MSVALKTPLHSVPSTDLEKIPALVEGLRATFTSGHTRSLDWRREQLRRLRQMVKDHGDEFGFVLDLILDGLDKATVVSR